MKVETLDSKFSRAVKLIAATGNNYVRCYTCHQIMPTSRSECGHYIVRGFYSHRWNFDNARVQCHKCNSERNGEPEKFRERLVKELGEDKVKRMEKRKNKKLTIELMQSANKEIVKEIKKYRGL